MRNIGILWRGIWRLRGPEMYLLGCICTTLSWFIAAVTSIYSSTIRRFYASGARVVLLVSTKFVCKAASIVTLALWRDAPPSSFCKWYLPVDGAVLLWQAHVAPVGATAQATIAAADAACTFCCCWLLSDRWPYSSVSTGTVLAVNLLLASASLWLADRMEQSDRRDYERALAADRATEAGSATGAGSAREDAADGGVRVEGATGGQTQGCLRATSPVVALCGIACCGCGCGDGDGSGAGTGSRYGGKEMDTTLLVQAASAGVDPTDAALARHQTHQHQPPLLSQRRQHQSRCISMDECHCLTQMPLTCTGGRGVGIGGSCSGGSAGGSTCGASASGGGGTADSEACSPATLSTTQSLSRALPSFSTLSNCSAFGGGGGSISAAGLTEITGSSRSTSRPSSCVGALMPGRSAGQQQLQLLQATTGRAVEAVAAPPGLAIADTTAAMGAVGFGGGPVSPPASAAARQPPPLSTTTTGPVAALGIASATLLGAADAADTAPVASPPPDAAAAALAEPPPLSPPPPAVERRLLAQGASGGFVSPLALKSTAFERSLVTVARPELDESGGVRTADELVACGGDEDREVVGDGGGSGDGVPSGAPPLGGGAPPPPSLGTGPLRQLRRLVQHLVLRGDTPAAAGLAAAAPPPPAAFKKTASRVTSTSGAASTCGRVSCSSSTSRSSEPRLCSYPPEGAAATGAAATATTSVLLTFCSATRQSRAAGPVDSIEACCETAAGASAAEACALGTIAAVREAWGCAPALVPGSSMLVSADCVLAHSQPPPAALADPLAQLQRQQQQTLHLQPQQFGAVGYSALSADAVPSVRPLQQQQPPRPRQFAAAPPEAAERAECGLAASHAGAAATAAAGVVVVGGKTTVIPFDAAGAATPAGAAQPQLATAPGAARYVTGVGGAAAAGADVTPFSTSYAPVLDTDSRMPRCFALAKALAARGGFNACYDAPALHHTRCSVKLSGVTPADLPYGFADRVASLLAVAGGSAAAAAAERPAAATAALAAVGVYVREGCVEVVADVLVPVTAAAAEALVVGLTGDERGGAAAASAAPPARMLAVVQDAAGMAAAPAIPPQHQQSGESVAAATAPLHPDRAAAEAMLDLLERSLLPQITNALSRPPLQAGAALSPLSVGMQATVGGVHAMAWHSDPTLPTAAAPPPPPPPTIVCVTPCCVPLNQASGDDTRDRRRQTLTLKVALAGSGVSLDAAQPPRVLVRHSGRCLAAVVRPCPERYAGCLAVTVELALSGIRPGLLFLEVAAAAAADGGGGGATPAATGALSVPWPVLVVGDARVAVEVMQLQQQLEAAAPLRAMQAETEVLQYHEQHQHSASGSHLQQQHQPQHHLPHLHARQLDGGTSSLLLDFGMWFEAVSVADTAVIAAAISQRSAAAARHPPSAAAPLPLPLTPPVTASAAEEGDGYEGQVQQAEEGKEVGEERLRGSGDGSTWESSEEHSSDEGEREEAAEAAVGAVARRSRTAQEMQPAAARRGSSDYSLAAGGDGGGDTGDVDAEVQMLLLRGLQPEQELLDGSLDCAAEYEQTCRQGAALQSAAAALGMRLLRFAVLRGWPAAGTLLLRGLLAHCRLRFDDVRLLFPAAAADMPLLHTAVMSGSLTMVRAVKAWAQRCRSALPWDESVVAAGGLTPLHIAAIQDNGRLAGAILGLWPDAEAQWAVARDCDGRTPQEYACMRALSASSSASSTSAPAAAVTSQLLESERRQQQRQQQLQASGGLLVRPFRLQDWSQGRELEGASAEQPQASARPPLQQLQHRPHRAMGLAEGGLVAASSGPAGQSYMVALAPQTQRPQRLPAPAQPDACSGDGGAAGGAAAANRSDDPGSTSSSVSTVPGVIYPGGVFGRSYRSSDCGSISMGPDSQWSHSTSATAQTHYNHQPTSTLQDLRSGPSPVKAVSTQDAMAAKMLSLANLPDLGTCSSSSGGAGAGSGTPGGGNAAAAAAGEAAPVFRAGAGSGESSLQPHIIGLSAWQLSQKPDAGRTVRASFQLDLAAQKSVTPSPPAPSLQLQQMLQQQMLQQQQQQRQTGDGPVVGAAAPSGGAVSCTAAADGLPVDSTRAFAGATRAGTSANGDAGWLAGAATPSPGVNQVLAAATAAITATDPAAAAAPAATRSGAGGAAATPHPPPARAGGTPQVAAAAATKTPQLHPQYRSGGASHPTPSRFSSHGVRLLASSLLGDGTAAAGSLPHTSSSPPGSTGSHSSAAAGTVGATAPYSTTSTNASPSSTMSLSSNAATTTRRHTTGDGRYSANTRRPAFADDYAPACQPTMAAWTSCLAGLVPLLSTVRSPRVKDRTAAARALSPAAGASTTATAATPAVSAAESGGVGARVEAAGAAGSGGAAGCASRLQPSEGLAPGLGAAADSAAEGQRLGTATPASTAAEVQKVQLPAESGATVGVAAGVPPPLQVSRRVQPLLECRAGGEAAAGTSLRRAPQVRLGLVLLLLAWLVLLAALVLQAVPRSMS